MMIGRTHLSSQDASPHDAEIWINASTNTWATAPRDGPMSRRSAGRTTLARRAERQACKDNRGGYPQIDELTLALTRITIARVDAKTRATLVLT